jgi:hypothetical protein
MRYGVFQLGGQWLLCCDERRLGRYNDLRTAVSAGQRAARDAMGSGYDAELAIEVRRPPLTNLPASVASLLRELQTKIVIMSRWFAFSSVSASKTERCPWIARDPNIVD